jgi:succinate dehydrogenase flavin-adding protein (antitoxin of CptAB toxin-antitoxin module)
MVQTVINRPADGDSQSGTQRNRLLFRSWHRGTQESDLLLGAFADGCLPTIRPLMSNNALRRSRNDLARRRTWRVG